MKQTTRGLGTGLAVALSLLLLPGPLAARGTIERACLGSDRPAASRALCGCLQTVADAMLTRGEQRRGAKLFSDPEQSQQVKMSDRRSDVLFWEKWESFAATAVRHCQ